jgi:hypothetical protein
MEQFVEGNENKRSDVTGGHDKKKTNHQKSTRRRNTYTHLFGLTKSAMEESTVE